MFVLASGAPRTPLTSLGRGSRSASCMVPNWNLTLTRPVYRAIGDPFVAPIRNLTSRQAVPTPTQGDEAQAMAATPWSLGFAAAVPGAERRRSPTSVNRPIAKPQVSCQQLWGVASSRKGMARSGTLRPRDHRPREPAGHGLMPDAPSAAPTPSVASSQSRRRDTSRASWRVSRARRADLHRTGFDHPDCGTSYEASNWRRPRFLPRANCLFPGLARQWMPPSAAARSPVRRTLSGTAGPPRGLVAPDLAPS
jgi:hypothetical protein